MIGQSADFLSALSLIERAAAYDVPVLIEGETGTGKELAARAIHYGGTRRDHPFIPVNCGAIPDTLIENELFGHQQGAFTDARKDQVGLIEHARYGTLFLDEIDALTPKAQVTLLRFLQDQQYRPLGARSTQTADVRIIAASNTDLTRLADSGAFRLDLLFRLKIMHIILPPLRMRRGDARILAQHFLAGCAERFGNGEKTLDASTLAWLDQYNWPGNIRELENLLCREYLLAEGAVIHIPPPAGLATERRAKRDRRKREAMTADFNTAKKQTIAEFERCYLTDILVATHGNVTQAAGLAGKERRAFGKLLKKHDIDKTKCAQ